MKKCGIYSREVYRFLFDHPNPHIPRIYAFWENEAQNELTVVEELVSGTRLDMLLGQGRLSDDEKKEIALELCDILHFLHSASPPIIHRDVKEENIMVREDGTVMLLDYDAAKVYWRNETRDTRLIGTEGSATPEQYGFRQSDARTDIYGLGVLLGKMFAGNKKMERIAEKATQMDPAKRYQTANEMKRDIKRGGISAGFTLPVPGFRTGTVWKMIIASFGYLMIFLLGFGMEITGGSTAAYLWVSRIILILIMLGLVDIFTGWTPVFRNFPFMKRRNVLLRILGYAIAVAADIFFWMIVLAILTLFL